MSFQERFKEPCQKLPFKFAISTLSGILPKIILDRFRNTSNSRLLKNKFGFRKNSSTIDRRFIVQDAIKSTKYPIHLLMIDLRAAYDEHRQKYFIQGTCN